MKGIFSYDGFLFQAINKFLDAIVLYLLWVVFSLPLVTMGASTTALFYTADKVIFHEEGKLISSFWGSFKQNFKQATLIGLLFGLVFCFLYLEVFYAYTLYTGGYLHVLMFGVIMVVTALVIMWSSYVFPYIAKYADPTKAVFKKCAAIMLFNMQWSIMLLAVLIASFFMMQLVPGGFVLAPIACLLSTSRITARVFRKYANVTDEQMIPENEEITAP